MDIPQSQPEAKPQPNLIHHQIQILRHGALQLLRRRRRRQVRETDEESKKCVKWLIIAFKEFFVVGFLFGFATTTESSIVLCSGRRYGRLIVCKITAIVFLSTCNYSSSCNPPTSPVHRNYYLHRQPSPPPPSLIGETKWQRRDCSHQFGCS